MRLFDSLGKIVRPVQREWKNFLAPICSTHVRKFRAIAKPLEEQRTDTTYPEQNIWNNPYLYIRVPHIFAKYSNSSVGLPFRQQDKFATLNLGLLCKASKGILDGNVQPGTGFIQFLFSKHWYFLLSLICPITSLCVQVYWRMNCSLFFI